MVDDCLNIAFPIILAVAVFLPGLGFLGAAVLMVLGIDVSRIKGWWIARKEKGLPMYERLARAEERQAEKSIRDGKPEWAARHWHRAKEIRQEATDAMMRGEGPF